MDCTGAVKRRYLVLENGKVFEGFAFGADIAAVGCASGEVVFATNMSGFAESVTDPNYDGQLVVQTFPLIGNTGVGPAQHAGQAHLTGYVVREWCQTPSHFTCTGTLDTFFTESGVPGIWGVDTRALTKLIRSEGVMRGVLADDPTQIAASAFDASKAGGGAVSRVSIKEPVRYAVENAQYKVALWDFGMKSSTVQNLNERGCDVMAMPHSWTAKQILAEKPDGVLLSGGPGNPEDYPEIVSEIKQLIALGAAIFGVGLGHQLLALANGGAIEKLRYGHRGGCSVKELATGRTLVTSQNHGYAAAMDKLPPNAKAGYINADDGSCEGLDYDNFNGFSAQFLPEGCWTPLGEGNLYDRFVKNMKVRAV